MNNIMYNVYTCQIGLRVLIFEGINVCGINIVELILAILGKIAKISSTKMLQI